MARTRPTASLFGSPVLIGALTVLIVIVAVFLAYNANQGLPFVLTYDLKAQVPSAANLVPGNEVRIGGHRVGAVDSIRPVRHPGGTTTAILSMKLDKSVQPLPIDSTILIRSRSALGLKYVQLTPGTSRVGLRAGDTMSLTQATPRPVELDERRHRQGRSALSHRSEGEGLCALQCRAVGDPEARGDAGRGLRRSTPSTSGPARASATVSSASATGWPGGGRT